MVVKKGGLLKSTKKKSPVNLAIYRTLAEREGFEPPVPLSTAVFKTAVIDHSTISPCANGKICLCLICECKDKAFYWLYQIFFSHSVAFTRFLRFL